MFPKDPSESRRHNFEMDDKTRTNKDPVKLTDEDMQTLKKLIIDSVRECAGRSSIHAFPSLSTKGVHPIIVLIWIVCLIGSWGYLGYQIYNTIVLYISYGVSTSLGVAFEVPTDFPGESKHLIFSKLMSY